MPSRSAGPRCVADNLHRVKADSILPDGTVLSYLTAQCFLHIQVLRVQYQLPGSVQQFADFRKASTS